MEKITVRERKLTSEQYRTFAKWFKEIGLGALGTLVAQQFLAGGTLFDMVALVGLIVAFIMYVLAFSFQLKA